MRFRAMLDFQQQFVDDYHFFYEIKPFLLLLAFDFFFFLFLFLFLFFLKNFCLVFQLGLRDLLRLNYSPSHVFFSSFITHHLPLPDVFGTCLRSILAKLIGTPVGSVSEGSKMLF
ncbi:hypothetical protein BDZ91DRAFT_252828 [Kalaharituber pfeilii]|nr:hypothetical protein BDZ91DRAFT_252828 [Kalaharituber pfeilii]